MDRIWTPGRSTYVLNLTVSAELAVHLRFGRYTFSKLLVDDSFLLHLAFLPRFLPPGALPYPSRCPSRHLSAVNLKSLSPIQFFLEEQVYPEKTISATSFFLSIATYLDEVVLAGCLGYA